MAVFWLNIKSKMRRVAFQVAAGLDRLARGGVVLVEGKRWLLSAMLAGAAPFVLCLLLGVPGHQLISALMVCWLCLACAHGDDHRRGVALIIAAYGAHGVAVIAASYWWPNQAALLLPGAQEYWARQQVWIRTGYDPEYELRAWVPAHLQLAVATLFFSTTSLGAITFYQGFFEVDLMNFYNARLMASSQSKPLALLLGWHPWSLLRGIGFALLTFEVCALALYLWSAQRSSWQWRPARWAWGVGFLVADGLVKFTLMEPVRAQLFTNLN
jgi:hypothetical protein